MKSYELRISRLRCALARLAICALFLLMGTLGLRAYPPAPATQAQVNAGRQNYLYVTPQTLSQYLGSPVQVFHGTNVTAYSTIDQAYSNMVSGDNLKIAANAGVNTDVAFTNVTFYGTPSADLVPNFATQFIVYSNAVFNGFNLIDTNLETFPIEVSPVNETFVGCNWTGGRPVYHHLNAGSMIINQCTFTGCSPVTTELSSGCYTLIENSTIIATNYLGLTTNLANPFVRGIYLSRSGGTCDVENVDIFYSDIGSTNPAYGVATDFGSIPYTARNVFSNSFRLFNVRFHGLCTNPLSADFLITTSNAYLIGPGVVRADGAKPTYYNPSNYANPFNYTQTLP